MIRVFTSKTQALGERGEGEAVTFLKKRGFSIVERNVPNKYGEIDIVGKKSFGLAQGKGSVYYFFEVKTGRSGGWLNPAENLTREKLRKFLISVEHYCLVHNIKDYRVQGIIVLFPQIESGEVKIEIMDIY